MYDVICMGSGTIDLFVTIDHTFKSCGPGEKILIHNLDYETGGGGTNSAASFAKLGVNTAYLGKLGDDTNAKRVIQDLKKRNVKIIPVKPSSVDTAFSVVLQSTKEKDRIIYVYKGSANELSIKDFDSKKINTKWIYAGTHLQKSLKTLKQVIKSSNAKVLFNPSEYLCRKPKIIKDVLKHTDILVLNKLEAQLLANSKKNVQELAKTLMKKGPHTVIITQGPRPLNYFDRIQHICLHPPKVKSVSTTGAGDAFTSGFLAGIIKGKDVVTSLRIGVMNASSLIKKEGAKNGLLTWNKALKQIKNRRLKCSQQVKNY